MKVIRKYLRWQGSIWALFPLSSPRHFSPGGTAYLRVRQDGHIQAVLGDDYHHEGSGRLVVLDLDRRAARLLAKRITQALEASS